MRGVTRDQQSDDLTNVKEPRVPGLAGLTVNVAIEDHSVFANSMRRQQLERGSPRMERPAAAGTPASWSSYIP